MTVVAAALVAAAATYGWYLSWRWTNELAATRGLRATQERYEFPLRVLLLSAWVVASAYIMVMGALHSGHVASDRRHRVWLVTLAKVAAAAGGQFLLYVAITQLAHSLGR